VLLLEIAPERRTRDHSAEWKTWLGWLDTVAKRVGTIPGVTTAVREPNGLSNRSPSLSITWDPTKLHITGPELADQLARTKPRVAVGAGGGRPAAGAEGMTSISVAAWMMQPGDDKVAADRIHGVLTATRSARVTEMRAPSVNVAGRWDVDITFSSSQELVIVPEVRDKLLDAWGIDAGVRVGEFTREQNAYSTITV